MNNARNNLAKYNNKVDYIIKYILAIIEYYQIYSETIKKIKLDFLSEIYHTAEYTHWFFGHMHINYTYEQGTPHVFIN